MYERHGSCVILSPFSILLISWCWSRVILCCLECLPIWFFVFLAFSFHSFPKHYIMFHSPFLSRHSPKYLKAVFVTLESSVHSGLMFSSTHTLVFLSIHDTLITHLQHHISNASIFFLSFPIFCDCMKKYEMFGQSCHRMKHYKSTKVSCRHSVRNAAQCLMLQLSCRALLQFHLSTIFFKTIMSTFRFHLSGAGFFSSNLLSLIVSVRCLTSWSWLVQRTTTQWWSSLPIQRFRSAQIGKDESYWLMLDCLLVHFWYKC